jgi:hypothetical protein
MKKFSILAALLMLIAIGCDRSTTPVEPQQSATALSKATSEQDDNFTSLVYNECCGELVQIEGTAHVVIRDNGFHYNAKGLTGTGTSGRTYRQERGYAQMTTNNGDAERGESTGMFIIRMVSDDGCSFTLKAQIHLRIENGFVTKQILHYEIICD